MTLKYQILDIQVHSSKYSLRTSHSLILEVFEKYNFSISPLLSTKMIDAMNNKSIINIINIIYKGFQGLIRNNKLDRP